MSCIHGEWINCERCEEIDHAYANGYRDGIAASPAAVVQAEPTQGDIIALSIEHCDDYGNIKPIEFARAILALADAARSAQ